MMHGHRVAWWNVVTAYPCPVCPAGPGEACITSSGAEKYEPHADRSRLASEHQWHDPEADGA